MRLELKAQSPQITEVLLTLDQTERASLAHQLQALDELDEVRLQDQGVTLYFKLRSSDCRVLIAHPEPHEWVVTVGLESAAMSAFSQKLTTAQTFKLTDFVPLSRVSNARLSIG